MRFYIITKQHKEKATHQFRSHQTIDTSKSIPYVPYNIVEELKITPFKMIIFDALRMPIQIDLLQEALKLRNNSRKRTSEDNIIIINTDDVLHTSIGIRRPPSFYLSLRL